MKYLLNILVMLMLSSTVMAQRDTETIKKSFNVTDANADFWFCLCNINGGVTVEAYNGSTIELELKKQIKGRSQGDVKQGMEELKMLVDEGDDYVKVLMQSPNQEIIERDDPLACGWNWNGKRRRVNYDFQFDYIIKVPKGISVKISTVNQGDLDIRNVEGNIYANNVNGDVTLEDIQGDTKASTVNGVLEVSYVKMPTEFGSFDTVNGDILIETPENANGVFNFQTQWGKVYSDLDFNAKLAPKVSKTSGKNGTMYKISNSNGYQLGKGGPTMEFETLNGDIRISKKK
ncbi:DUF4097 family beta strand repeat-containing protein [Roseivirga sp. E12]|uniref:DUF4097 family beta strand repeat-containing protein n=1 Tax=Roseivirga sp. E12 TaxID=2819237 RepID=UPI001ABCCEB3|nr:DUF4097 family beta strand repeat-containing protein [Roseivirga sp. E12]